jgi:thiamine biosynthesis lipoprotein
MFERVPETGALSRMRPLLGTLVAVEAETAIGSDAALAIEAAFAAVERVSELMHPTRPGSDLERIAAATPGTPVQVHDWTLRVLRQSAELNRQSRGSFDPCLPGARGRMPDIEIHADHVVCHAPVSLDLGGIAKGFAVDVAVAELRRHGCVAGMVNAGGDLRVFGPEPRVVYVRGPAGDGIPIKLLGAALAVSEPRSDAAPSEHRGYYEGISGRPVVGRPVAVIATNAMIADALCKCALLCAPPLLGELLATHEARLPQVTVSRVC